MCWHHRERNNDGKMRHPRDGDAWKAFNSKFPDFAVEPRNVRLGIASDGFNPFGACNQKYSIWPRAGNSGPARIGPGLNGPGPLRPGPPFTPLYAKPGPHAIGPGLACKAWPTLLLLFF